MSLSPSAPRTNASDTGNDAWRRRVADEVVAVLMQTLDAFDPDKNTPLAGIERLVREALRGIGAMLTSRLALQAAGRCARPNCPGCGRPMEVRHRRGRHVRGLTGDLELPRTEYTCRACGEAQIPAHGMWELGAGGLSPELSRVLAAACAEILSYATLSVVPRPELTAMRVRVPGECGRSRTLAAEWRVRQAAHAWAAHGAAAPPVSVPAEARRQGPICPPPIAGQSTPNSAGRYKIPSFERAAALVGDVLGVTITPDTAGRTSEAIGAVAETEIRESMAAPAQPQPETVDGPTVLMVGMDACKAFAGRRWRDVKVGVVAPLGPATATDEKTGRTSLVLGPRTYCAAVEDADRFYDRILVHARQAGWHPTRRLQVVLLGDGGPWIWARADRLRGEGVEVHEILDIYHVREHIWTVAHAVLGTGARSHQWGESLAGAVLEHGAAPVLEALRRLRPRGKQQRDIVRQAVAYFEDNATRMRYATYLAKGFPIGSGVVESSCRLVCGLRCKQPGMRWSLAGVQSILTLRALRLSQTGGWEHFWSRAPQTRRPPVNTLTKTQDQAA